MGKKVSLLVFFAVFMSMLLCGAVDQDAESQPGSMKLFKSFCGVQGQGCGAPALLEMVSVPRMFSISSPGLVTCTCLLWQTEPLVAEGKTNSPAVKKKRLGRAIFRNMVFVAFNSIKYWIKKEWPEDWDYQLTWKDQKKRCFSLEAYRFDSNPFKTNWSHILGGGFSYNFARYHGLDPLESILYSTCIALFWEYVSEYHEVISVNDIILSGIGSVPFGEPLFRIGSHFQDRPGAFNKIVGSIFSPGVAINALLDGKNRQKRFFPGFSRPYFDVYIGPKQVSGVENNRFGRLFHVGIATSFNTIPGYGDTGTVNRFLKHTLLSEVYIDGTFGPNTLEEYSFFSKAVLFGRFIQAIKQDPAVGLKGYSLFFGGGSAFDLFLKKATAYYDKSSYHYDFKGGEQPPQPTGFTDKLAVINLFGPVFDLSVYANRLKLRLSVDLYADFAFVNSMALNRYSIYHDLFQPRLKTTLVHYGYYYALGFTFSLAGGVQYRNVEINGKFKYQYYDSIDGRDRFQSQIEDDCNVTDRRLWYKVSFGYGFANTPVKLVFTWEGIDRSGSLKEVSHRVLETRLYTQLKISFQL